jgi:phosphate transport system permease protein
MSVRHKSFWSTGEPFIWLTGGALTLALLLVVGLITLIVWNGTGFFWPKDVTRLTLSNGSVMTGQIVEREPVPGKRDEYRIKVKVANRDLYGADFQWVDESRIAMRERPAGVAVIERTEWGLLIGTLKEVRDGGKAIAVGEAGSWAAVQKRMDETDRVRRQIRAIEKVEIGAINARQEALRLKLKGLELKGIASGPQVEMLQKQLAPLQEKYEAHTARLAELRKGQTLTLVVAADGGKEKVIPLAQVLDVRFPNAMGSFAKSAFYVAHVWEFVSGEPREANTEGGVFPAIFGTILMVILMSIVVTPLGVLAAFYLREYSRQGPFVSAVRIAVNNLAGVPSIVFGVFGLGFFIYGVGGAIDRLFFAEALPTPTFGTGGILWASLTLALLTVPVVIVATEEGLAAIPGGMREASLALSATKLETTLRVVLPAVMPSILTGLILAMARAAGEVAPLMITGVVKLAPSLPIDGQWPFFHFERKFMHLGFQIYDTGFQSPNVDAARPMVFATTLLLLVIVVFLNLFAIATRNRLRRKYATSAV